MPRPVPESPFAHYPRRPARYAASLGTTLVVIPHPDDEALGCGGLLALLHRAGHAVQAVLVSDGTMSHPNSLDFPPAARRAVRETELRLSLNILGAEDENLLTLGLPDSQVPSAGPAFDAAAGQLRELLRRQKPATLLVPWRRDPHPDHRATSRLVRAALAGLSQPPRVLEYIVWAWQRAVEADLPQPEDHVQGFRLNIRPVLNRKRRAIAAHRSQVTPGIFTDDPAGFLLSNEMLAHFEVPYEVFLEPIMPTGNE